MAVTRAATLAELFFYNPARSAAENIDRLAALDKGKALAGVFDLVAHLALPALDRRVRGFGDIWQTILVVKQTPALGVMILLSGAASFFVGAAYAAWTIATQSHVTNSSVLLILLSVVIFLVGLVSEQISSLRFEGRRS